MARKVTKVLLDGVVRVNTLVEEGKSYPWTHFYKDEDGNLCHRSYNIDAGETRRLLTPSGCKSL